MKPHKDMMSRERLESFSSLLDNMCSIMTSLVINSTPKPKYQVGEAKNLKEVLKIIMARTKDWIGEMGTINWGPKSIREARVLEFSSSPICRIKG